MQIQAYHDTWSFDGSYVKLIVVEVHNIQNITGYVVSMTLLWIKLFFCVNDWQVYYKKNLK